MKVFYYGGKFNPITKGHLKVIRRVLDSKEFKDAELHIGVKGVFDKEHPYTAGLVERMIAEALKAEPDIAGDRRIKVVVQDIDRTWPFLQKQYSKDDEITLVMGSDRYEEFKTSFNAEKEGRVDGNVWLNTVEISERCHIMPVDRGGCISSSRVREILRRDPYAEYDLVRDYVTRPVFDYIKRLRLYSQFGYEDDYRREEGVFLAGYDMSKFPRPSVTVDNIVTRMGQDGPEVLLVRRGGMPYEGFWALPGGFLDVKNDQSLEDAAARELSEETLLHRPNLTMTQFRAYGDMGVDPRGRVVDVVFKVHVNTNLVARSGDDASEVAWFPLDDLPRMAFNHRRILEDYIEEECR